MLVADYTFFDFFWSMFVVFIWIMWFWLLFTVWFDIFRRDDISGWSKALWLIFTIVLPFLGVFIYLITQNDEMTKRSLERHRRDRQQFDDYVRQTAGSGGSAAEEIARGKELLDSGVITQAEFDVLKTNALSA
jgi:Phospholipase_D-nuclease N-terminal